MNKSGRTGGLATNKGGVTMLKRYEQLTLLEIKKMLLDAIALVDIAAKGLGDDHEYGKRLKEIDRELFDIMYDL